MDLKGEIKLFGAFPDVVARVVSNVSGFIGVPKRPAGGRQDGRRGGLVH